MSLRKTFALVSCIVVASLVFQGPAFGSVIAQYNLDESSITVGTTHAVESIGGYDLIYRNAATSVAGRWGLPERAVDFGANGYASSATTGGAGALAYNQTNATIELYFKLNSLPAAVAEIYNEGTGSSYLWIGVVTSGSNFVLQSGVSRGGAWGPTMSIPTALSAGTWYYAALTVSGDSYSLHLYDGTLEPASTVTTSGTKGSPNSVWLATQYPSSSALPLNGVLDNVTVYNTALDDQTLINHATGVPEPGTLALLVTALAGLLCYAWRKRR